MRPLRMRLQAADPKPTAKLNSARIIVEAARLACSTSLVKGWICDKNTTPKSQNHEIPKMESHTSRLVIAVFTVIQVSCGKFQLIFISAWAGGAGGMNQVATYPTTARPIITKETKNRPKPAVIKKVPNNMPINMEMAVPLSIRPLPPNNSFLFKCCGRIEYLIGPKNVDCVPARKTQNICSAMFSV